jgi:hypothetical protein
MTRRRQPEAEIQRSLVAHLQWRAARDCYWFAVPNGGARRPIEAAIMKGLGVRAGTPDLILIRQGRAHGLEIKAKQGRVSDPQRACHAEMTAAGATVAVATGIDEAIEVLEGWGLLRGRAS